MKGQMHTDLGQVIIDEEVIATYAGINAIECFGIVGMASVNMKDGFAQLLKRDNVSKGVHIKINDNKIYIDFHIIVVYGVSIATVTEKLVSLSQVASSNILIISSSLLSIASLFKSKGT